MVENAKAMRGLRVDHFTEIEHFGGDGRAYKLRQEISAAVIGKQADLGKILAEDGAIDSEADIAGESKIHPSASGRTVDGCDDRLRHGANVENSLHSHAKDGCKFSGIVALTAFADGPEVAPGAKGAACACEDDNVNGGIAGNANERCVQSGGELVIEGVQAVGEIGRAH